MSQHQLDYAGPDQFRSPVRKAWAVTGFFTLGWFAANVILFVISRWGVGGFQGMGVEVFGAVALNASLVVIAIALSVWFGRTAGPAVLCVFLLGLLFPAATLGGAIWVIYG
jgi:hypothetical protein